MPIWKVIRPRPASCGRPAIRPDAGARHAEQRRILARRAGHAQNPVQPARASRQPDVLQVDLRALRVGGPVIGKRRPLRVERQRRQSRALRHPRTHRSQAGSPVSAGCARAKSRRCRGRDRCGRRLPRSQSIAGSRARSSSRRRPSAASRRRRRWPASPGGSISGPMPYFTVAPTAWWPSRSTSIRNVAASPG